MTDLSALLEFWDDYPKEPPFLHPADKQALSPTEIQELEHHGVQFQLFPQPWVGPLKTANAFILQLNPGYSQSEDEIEKNSPEFRAALRDNLRGTIPNFFLDERFTAHPGQAWVQKILRGVAPVERLAREIVQLEICPYHSHKFPPYLQNKLCQLPSSQVVRDFVHASILPAAHVGKKFLLAQRGVRRWGLTNAPESSTIIIYTRGQSQSGSVSANTPGGQSLQTFLKHRRA